MKPPVSLRKENAEDGGKDIKKKEAKGTKRVPHYSEGGNSKEGRKSSSECGTMGWKDLSR